MKHTQGPWNVVYRDMNGAKTDKPSAAQLASAYVDNPHGITIADCGCGDANAKLIAAAPELLESLQLAQKWIEFAKKHCGLGTVAGGDWYIDQDKIRKALAKASE